MSSYNLPNGGNMSGKYRPNFGGFQPQLYCWKKWFNNSGFTAFIPENTQAERISVNNGLQNAPGLSRILGRFGSPNGVTIVSSTPASVYPYCIAPRFAGDPGGPGGCPGGTNDITGSMLASETCGDIVTGPGNPYNSAGLGACYVFESGNSETSGGGWNNFLCPGGFFTTVRIRYCAEPNSTRGNCWEDCN